MIFKRKIAGQTLILAAAFFTSESLYENRRLLVLCELRCD